MSIERAGLLNNAMPLLYAPALGFWCGVFQESLRPRTPVHALVFGSTVWGRRVTLNPPLRLREPFRRDPVSRDVVDASFHPGRLRTYCSTVSRSRTWPLCGLGFV